VRFVVKNSRDEDWADEIATVDAVVTMPAASNDRLRSGRDKFFRRIREILRPEGLLLYAERVSRNVGRGVGETLRVLQALQTGRLCPADWRPGDETFDPELDAARPS